MDAAESPTSSAARWGGLGRRDLVGLLSAYVLSRALVFAAMGAVTYLHLSGARCGDVLARPIVGFSGLSRCWDTTWFLRTAAQGYPSVVEVGGNHRSTLAFFPGWPGVIRAGSAVGLPPLFAATALAVVLGGVATVLVALLGSDLAGPVVGVRAALLFCFFPGALVLSWGYSEALAATLVAGCLLLLRRRAWVAAGVCAAAGSATRADVGVALCAATAVGAYLAIRQRRDWRALWAPALAPLGALAYLGFVWTHTGSVTAWTQVQSRGWNQGFDFGAQAALTAWRSLSQPGSTAGRLISLVALVLLVAGVVALIRRPFRLPGSWLAYTVVALALGLVSRQVGFRPRAELLLLPAFVAAAGRLSERTTAWVLLVFAVLQTLFVVLLLGVPYIPPP